MVELQKNGRGFGRWKGERFIHFVANGPANVLERALSWHQKALRENAVTVKLVKPKCDRPTHSGVKNHYNG